jgi:hypothetical protein
MDFKTACRKSLASVAYYATLPEGLFLWKVETDTARSPTRKKTPFLNWNQQMAGVKGKSGGSRANSGVSGPGAGRKPKSGVPKSANGVVSELEIESRRLVGNVKTPARRLAFFVAGRQRAV